MVVHCCHGDITIRPQLSGGTLEHMWSVFSNAASMAARYADPLFKSTEEADLNGIFAIKLLRAD